MLNADELNIWIMVWFMFACWKSYSALFCIETSELKICIRR